MSSNGFIKFKTADISGIEFDKETRSAVLLIQIFRINNSSLDNVVKGSAVINQVWVILRSSTCLAMVIGIIFLILKWTFACFVVIACFV